MVFSKRRITGLGLALAALAGCRAGPDSCTNGYAARASTLADATPAPAVVQTSAESPAPEAPLTPGRARLSIPPELPGANSPALRLPPFDPTQSIPDRRTVVEQLFPEIPAEPLRTPLSPDSLSPPLSLGALQQIALDNSPVIRQAAADVDKSRGQARQAGLYPNPIVGYEGDTIGTADTAGYNGVFFNQEIVTAGKLSLAQNSALMEMRAAEQNLRKSRITLASGVRRGYFGVLVAQERLKFARAIAHLSNEAYQAQVDLVAAGEAAPYEPLQLRVFAVRAHNSVIQAENQLQAAWRQLAATMGVPTMVRAPLTGSVDAPIAAIEYESAMSFLLARHTDLAANRALIGSACYNLKLQQVTPIPNIDLYTALQHDDTTPLDNFSANVQIGIPVPVFNRNQGNITAAHAQLLRAQQDLTDTRNRLLSDLADAHYRYDTYRIIADSYRSEILQDQVQVFRGVYDRFLTVGETIDFAQVVVAQQALSQIVLDYLQVLSDEWNAAVDLAELLQVDDFYGMASEVGGPGLNVHRPAPPEAPPGPLEPAPAAPPMGRLGERRSDINASPIRTAGWVDDSVPR